MTLETIFITQIASILGFIVVLFILYRVLVSAKDATIEMLKQKNSLLEQKIKELSDQDPDILLQRYTRKIDALEKELNELESESSVSVEILNKNKEQAEKIKAELRLQAENIQKSLIKTRHVSMRLRKHLLNLYDNSCQVCGIKDASVMEICRIHPLSKYCEESIGDMLLLCSNHHRLLDIGKFSINEDYSLIGMAGSLTVAAEHDLSKELLSWHREYVYKKQP